MDAVFKALADANRRKLLDGLHKSNGQTLSELCEYLDMTRQAVTKHLVLLEEAKLVVTVWRGREKLHYLNPVPLHEISERWVEIMQLLAPAPDNDDEIRRFQQQEVLGHGLSRHVEVFTQFAERLPVVLVQLVEQLSSALVSQCFEYCVQLA